MPYGNQWNTALSNIGSSIANVILTNKAKREAEDAKIQAGYDKYREEERKAREQALNRSESANIIDSLINPQGQLPNVSINAKTDTEKLLRLKDTGYYDIYEDVQKGITAQKKQKYEAQKSDAIEKILKQYNVKPELAQLVKLGELTPYQAITQSREEKPKLTGSQHIFNKNGYLSIKENYSDGSSVTKATATKWVTKKDNKKILTPEGKNLFNEEWSFLRNRAAEIALARKGNYEIIDKETGETVDLEDAEAEFSRASQIYEQKVKNTLPLKAQQLIEEIDQVDIIDETEGYGQIKRGKGKASPERFWGSVIENYNQGAFDINGTKEKEDNEIFALQTLRELFKARYYFDPLERYGY